MSFGLKQYHMELDGVLYFCRKGRISQIKDLSEVRAHGPFVSDLPGSVTRVMSVEGPAKYAAILARKRLEETGELDQPANIIIHWRKKGRQGATDILFTACPKGTYERYINHIEEQDEPILLFPLYEVLYRFLKASAGKRPTGVVFQHGRVADLIIGTKSRIFFSSRSMAFDKSDEQIQSLWETVLSDIRSCEDEKGIEVGRVIVLTWIDSRPPSWKGELGFRLDMAPEERLQTKDSQYRVSLPGAMKRLKTGLSMSGPKEKLAYCSRRALVPSFMCLALAVGILFWAAGYYANRAEALASAYKEIQHKISLKAFPAEPKHNNLEHYKEEISFIQKLWRIRQLPSLKELVNDISDAFSKDMVVELMRVDYQSEKVVAELEAKAKSPFNVAHRDYLTALGILSKKGYQIEERGFSTNIKESKFSLRLSKGTP